MLTEAELRRLYLDEKLTEGQIAQQHGMTQMQVNRLRAKLGISTLSKTDRLDLPLLTPTQKAVLLGSMMGDGRLQKVSDTTADYHEFHSDAQAAYLDWKIQVWGKHFSSVRPKTKSERGKVYTGRTMRTHTCHELLPYWKQFYPKGSGDKTFTEVDFTDFDALSLAVWFMDDGSKVVDKGVRFHISPDVANQEVAVGLLQRFGLKPSLYPDQEVIFLHDQDSLSLFLDLVSEHIHPSMTYKLDLVPRRRGSTPRAILSEGLLKDYVDQGFSAVWIAEATGTSVSSVKRALHQWGLKAARSSQFSWTEAKNRIQGGLSDQELISTLVALPMPEEPSNEDVTKDFTNLQAKTLAKNVDGVISGGGRVGQIVCKGIFDYRYEANKAGTSSLKSAWFDAEKIRKAVEFQRKVGDPVYPSNVFRALKALSTAPSNFRPAVAKKLVEEFCPPGGVVLDPCAGYGGRAVGTLAAGRRYIGVDPHPKAGEAYKRLQEVLGKELTFYNEPFEDVSLPEIKADLVLTSPPYFSVERYSNDPKQSWVRYPTLALWEERFLHVLLAKVFNALKEGGWALINIADCLLKGKPVPLVESTLRLAALVGFEHVGTLSMQLANFGRVRYEPILVFQRKGDNTHVPTFHIPKGQLIRDSYPTSVVGLTKDSLIQMYSVELMTDGEIATKLGVSDVLISQQRKLHGIPTLSYIERAAQKTGRVDTIQTLTREKLSELYQTMSDTEIGQRYGVSKVTIRNRRKQFGIAAISKTERAKSGKYR